MCGRFVLASPVDRLAGHFAASPDLDVAETYQPSFNVAPTHPAIGLVYDGSGHRRLRDFRWGLVPPWAADPSIGSRLFNARAESVAGRPAFREAFRSRRLAVVADGFFEWRRGPGAVRRPLYLRRRDGAPLAFAGLWERWRGGEEGLGGGGDGWLRSCTIITTPANADLAGVHDRMPALLEAGALERWLDPGQSDARVLRRLLVPSPAGCLVGHPVSPLVGDVRNDGPWLIEPVEVPAEAAGPAGMLVEQPTLFDLEVDADVAADGTPAPG